MCARESRATRRMSEMPSIPKYGEGSAICSHFGVRGTGSRENSYEISDT